MRALLVALLFSTALPAFAGGIAGYYASASTRGPTWREVCITELPRKQYRVVVSTSYCPSTECANLRMDSVSFESSERGGTLTYADGECNMALRVVGGRATVAQAGMCGEQRLLASSGSYEKRDAEVRENDCSPQSDRH